MYFDLGPFIPSLVSGGFRDIVRTGEPKLAPACVTEVNYSTRRASLRVGASDVVTAR